MNKRTDNIPRVVAAIMEREGRVLIARRCTGGIGGSWEFPGGKLDDGELPEHGLERELAEELGVACQTGEYFCTVPYRSEALSIDLLAYRVSLAGEDFKLIDHDEVRWVAIDELNEFMFSEPDRPVVRLLRNGAAGLES